MIYQIEKKLPREKKIKTNRTVPVKPYIAKGSLYLKKSKKFVELPEKTGKEQNWNNHTSPDKLPKFHSLHKSHKALLKYLVHRAKSQTHLDFKVSDAKIAEALGVSDRYVRKMIKELADMGFIGRCWVRGKHKGKFYTWRMIRLHWIAWMSRWEFGENANRFRYDYRPDSVRMQAVYGEYVHPFSARVYLSNKVDPKWLLPNPFEQNGQMCNPAWETDADLLNLIASGAYDMKIDDEFLIMGEAYEYGQEWAVRVMGVRQNLDDGIIY